MGLPRLSVHRPITISMLFIGIIIAGMIFLGRLPVELYPNFSFGVISIFVDIRGGMPPTEVENLVAMPIEEAVGTVNYLTNILSISEEGRCIVQMWFEPGTDMDLARLDVSEKFSRVRSKLPSEIEKPIIAKYDQAQYPIYIIAVAGEGYDPEALRKIVDDRIKENIQRVVGVANVEIGGGRERKILIEVDQAKLQAHNLSIMQIINNLNLNNLNLLAGEIKKVKDKYLIRTIGTFQTLLDIGQIGVSVAPSGSLIKVKDVAEIKDSFLEPSSFARVNVLPVVNLYIQKESVANTIEVTKGIQAELNNISKGLDPAIRLIPTYNQADAIKRAIKTVKDSLYIGAFLAVLVLLFFLRDSKSIFIIGVSIPISIIATFIFMYFRRITINVMTLSGLAIASGMLLDNSIVVLENIFSKKSKGLAPLEADIVGSEEMLLAITASTLTTIEVFLPFIYLSSRLKILYGGFAMTVAFSLMTSLLVALTLVPMLSARLGKKEWIAAEYRKKDVTLQPLFKKIRKRYRQMLTFSLRRRWGLSIILLAVFISAVYVFQTKVEKEFIGAAEQEDFTIFVELPTGAKLGASDKVVSEAEKILKNYKEILTITSRVEPWSSKIYVKLVPVAERKRSTKEIISALRPEMEKIQPAFIYFEEPAEVEANEVIVDIYGFDYKILEQMADVISSRMATIKGLTDVKIRHRPGRPEYMVIVDKEKAALFGLPMEEVANIIHAQMRGLRATLYHTEAKEIEVIVRLAPKYRKSIEQLKKLTITLPDGRKVFLDQIAEVKKGLGPSKIWRKNKNRMVQVSANKGKFAFGTAVEYIRGAVKDVKFPEGYFYKFGENYEEMVRNQREITFALLLSVILIYMTIAALFESFSQPLIIMVTIPMAAIGVILAIRLRNIPVNIAVMIGMMTLGGVVVNNAIILIDHINRLQEHGVATFRALIQSGLDRMRPILMTTITTVLALVPTALDRSPEGVVFWSPFAITVMSGLIFSTILTLFMVPCIYLVLEDVKGIFRR